MQEINLMKRYWTLPLRKVSHVYDKRLIKSQNSNNLFKFSFIGKDKLAELLLNQYDTTIDNKTSPYTIVWIVDKSKMHFSLTYTHRFIRYSESNMNDI